jgi:CheY-like chemotaxis protein
LHAWRDGDRIWIEVRDTGVGMTQAELAELFVPFRQGAAGQEKGGTGLGLALSRDMARAMGGELVLLSAPGAGTQARVWLPLPPTAAATAGASIGEGAQVLDADTPCTALVIEDDADSRVVLVNLLRSAGCTVEEAHDGREGLARCRDARFDIVFSDIRMPNMNGVELIEALRADPATRSLPVIAVSASSLEHERRFYIERGFQDFIGKPYPFHEVYRALVDHAGVRLQPAGGAPLVPVAAPSPSPAGLATSVRAQLRELITAAAGGRVSAVARLMAALQPEAIGHERWDDFDEAAQAYDFQLLELRARELLTLAEAVDRGIAGTGVAG